MQKWKYMFITCRTSEDGQWRPNFINGNEIPNFFAGSPIHQVSNDLGEKGWELVGYTALADVIRLVFKRPE
jgi:hypothetical protein